MIFPEFLKKGDIIGVTAPSDGNRKEMDFRRLELAKVNLSALSHNVLETPDVRKSEGGRSSDAKTRAEEFMSLILNPSVKAIIFAKGGDFLMEMLPFLDYDIIAEHPKWMQGFSDCTGILFSVATRCQMATLYGNHFNDYAMKPWHPAIDNNWSLLHGTIPIQHSFTMYSGDFYDRLSPEEPYHLDKTAHWHSDGTERNINISGRLLGGCMDVLLNLIGTDYAPVNSFVENIKEDKVIWYLESFSLDAESISRGLWQMKEAGWFEHVAGFCFGRPCMFESFLGYSYEECVMSQLAQLHVPVIFDMDIGHKEPQFTLINGALCEVNYHNGEGSLSLKI